MLCDESSDYALEAPCGQELSHAVACRPMRNKCTATYSEENR